MSFADRFWKYFWKRHQITPVPMYKHGADQLFAGSCPPDTGVECWEKTQWRPQCFQSNKAKAGHMGRESQEQLCMLRAMLSADRVLARCVWEAHFCQTCSQHVLSPSLLYLSVHQCMNSCIRVAEGTEDRDPGLRAGREGQEPLKPLRCQKKNCLERQSLYSHPAFPLPINCQVTQAEKKIIIYEYF